MTWRLWRSCGSRETQGGALVKSTFCAWRGAARLGLFAVAVMVGVAGPVLAHATLQSSDPVPDAVLAAIPQAVRLQFTEPVEINASIFKVYPLADEADSQRLKAAASQLVNEVLRARGDEDRRADAGVAADGVVAGQVQILLKEDLPPGPYVVMWRVLSIDTHVTQGFFVFRVEPGGAGS